MKFHENSLGRRLFNALNRRTHITKQMGDFRGYVKVSAKEVRSHQITPNPAASLKLSQNIFFVIFGDSEIYLT
jgi:hypothetical protein